MSSSVIIVWLFAFFTRYGCKINKNKKNINDLKNPKAKLFCLMAIETVIFRLIKMLKHSSKSRKTQKQPFWIKIRCLNSMHVFECHHSSGYSNYVRAGVEIIINFLQIYFLKHFILDKNKESKVLQSIISSCFLLFTLWSILFWEIFIMF